MILGQFSLSLSCDGAECAAVFQALDLSAAACRKKARRAGWTLNSRRAQAYCARCTTRKFPPPVEEKVAVTNDLLDGTAFSAALGVAPTTLRMYLARGEIVAIKSFGGRVLYPAWQLASNGGVIPGLAHVLKILNTRGCTTSEVVRFFTLRNDHMRARPMDVLRAGEMARVIAVANTLP